MAGALMALFLLSLTGFHRWPASGPKRTLILAAIQAGGWLTAVAVLAMINAAAAAVYYLRVVVYMYMRDPVEETAPTSPGILFRAGLAIVSVGTLAFGLFPAPGHRRRQRRDVSTGSGRHQATARR